MSKSKRPRDLSIFIDGRDFPTLRKGEREDVGRKNQEIMESYGPKYLQKEKITR